MLSQALKSGATAVLCAALFFVSGSAEAADKPRKLEIIAFLQARDFETLERLYANPVGEDTAQPNFWHFEHSEPANEAHLTAWITAYPNSAAALTARGTYYTHIAWLNRGHGFIQETHPKQLIAMREYFETAEADFDASLELEPSQEMPYLGLMVIARATGKAADYAELMKQGLAVKPQSSAIYAELMDSLGPRWGGSLERLNKYIEVVQAEMADRPGFDFLKGYMSYILAREAYFAGKSHLALTHVDKAIAENPTASSLALRAGIIAEWDSAKALSDLDQAIALAPNNGDYWADRAFIYLLNEQFPRALEDIEMAVALDPYEPDYLAKHGNLLLRVALQKKLQGRINEFDPLTKRALLSLERTRVHGGNSTQVRTNVGRTIVTSIFSNRNFEKYHARALEVAPNNPVVWEAYVRSFAILRQCDRVPEARQAARIYQRVCLASGCEPATDLDDRLNFLDQSCRSMAGKQSGGPAGQWQVKIVRSLRRCQPFYDQHDFETAFKRCLAVAQEGNAAAQLDVSVAYMTRLGVPEDFAAAANWAERAAQQGDGAAQGKLGLLFLMGSAGEVRIEDGLQWIRKSVEQGSAEGFLGMAVAYHEGLGVEQDDDQAFAYLARAIELGSDEAKDALRIWRAQSG